MTHNDNGNCTAKADLVDARDNCAHNGAMAMTSLEEAAVEWACSWRSVQRLERELDKLQKQADDLKTDLAREREAMRGWRAKLFEAAEKLGDAEDARNL